MANEYVTVSEFKERIDLDPSMKAHENRIARVLARSSRAVDNVCHRRFYRDLDENGDDAPASPRRFAPSTSCSVWVDDFWTTDDLEIAVDFGDDGTFEQALSVADYELEPINGVVDGESGWPFSRIVTTRTITLPTTARRRSIQVTAKWGWAEVPGDVAEATEIMAAEMLKMHEAPFGVIGGLGDFAFRVRENPIAMRLLAPYVKDPILVA